MAGGSNDVKETEAEKAAAQVADEQWALYKNELSQFEDQFMGKVDNLNSEQLYQDVAGNTNLGYQSQFGQARGNAATSLASTGVDPKSGKYRAAMDGITEQQVTGQINTTNRAQTDQGNKYVAGLQDVVSVGQGQKAEALQGYDSLASTAQRQAINDASNAQESSNSIKNAAGTATGLGLGYYMNNSRSSEVSVTPNSPSSATKKSFTGSFG